MIFANSISQKSEADKFIGVFDYDGGWYCFHLSCIMTLLFVKEVLNVFLSYFRPVWLILEDKMLNA